MALSLLLSKETTASHYCSNVYLAAPRTPACCVDNIHHQITLFTRSLAHINKMFGSSSEEDDSDADESPTKLIPPAILAKWKESYKENNLSF